MNVWTKRGYDIFDPVDAAGNPRKVINGEVQVWSTEVERAIYYAMVSGNLAYATKADLDADLAHDDGTVAWVVADTAALNGIYVKSGASGSGSWTKERNLPTGPQGDIGGVAYRFDAGTADADPGTGLIRANKADLSAATELYVSKSNRYGDDLSAFLATLADSTSTHKGYLILTAPDSETQAAFSVSGLTDASGYVKLAVLSEGGATAFSDAERLIFLFSRTGNAGDLNGVNPGATGLALLETNTPAEAQAVIGATGVVPVDDRATLKALDTTKDTTAYLKEAGREDIFDWRVGDYSTEIAADTQEGIYIKADGVAATAGAWVRRGGWHVEGVNPLWFGVVADGVTDDTAAFQTTIDAAIWSRAYRVKLPGNDIRLTSTINIYGAVNIQGVGVQTHTGSIGELNPRGRGAWLYLDHSGKGLSIIDSAASGDGMGRTGTASLSYFGTYRNRADPTGTAAGAYVPEVFEPDVYFAALDLYLDQMVLLNPTTGVEVGAGGRLFTNGVRGQPLKTGIDIKQATDSCRVSHIHWWPYWSNNAGVRRYQRDNATAIALGRADNPHLDHVFCIGFYAGVRCYYNSTGVVGRASKVKISDCDFDLGQFAILVELAADGAYGTIVNTTAQGITDSGYLDAVATMSVNAPNSHWALSNCELKNSRGWIISCQNSNSVVKLSNFRMGNWDNSNSGKSAFRVEGGGQITSDSWPHITTGSAGSGGIVGGGNGRITISGAFQGRFTGDVSTQRVPVGWSVTRAGAGNYSVAHNLGLPSGTTLNVNATPAELVPGGLSLFDVANSTGNNFRLRGYVGTTLTDMALSFSCDLNYQAP